LLVASCLLMLAAENSIHGWTLWAAIVILCREILVSGLREYLEDRVWSVVGAHQPPGERERRRALIASQLIGLGWARYVLRLEPLASAPVEDVARWVGPTLDRYLKGPLEPPGGEEAHAAPAPPSPEVRDTDLA